MMDSTTFVPTLRTAASPNRMSSPTEENRATLALTSGGSTLMPMRRHSARYTADLSLSSPTLVSNAAMYSARKLALRYAVQNEPGRPAVCALLKAYGEGTRMSQSV
jgi:hypothetical protein